MTISDLQKLLVDDPFNNDLRIEYVDLLIIEGDFETASQQLELILNAAPDNQQALKRKQALSANNNNQEEQNELEKEPDLIPTSPFSVVDGGKSSDPVNVVSITSNQRVRFSDIAGMVEAKKTIKRRIIDPFANPGLFNKFKKTAGGGVLLYGPPGCGKTMLAKAIATECNATFISVGISDILSMYKGESELQLASVFDRARISKPSVLFFDELDALAYSRSKASSDYTRTIVNEFLNQLDGSQTDNEQILILGATNMPWDVDDAMKRPGRFDRQVFIPPLDVEARQVLLEQKLVNIPTEDLNYKAIAEHSEHFSGADMDALIDAAKDHVLDEIMDGKEERGLNDHDFVAAIEEINPSTLDWLKTARNLVKFGNAGGVYKEVEKYLRSIKLY